MLTGPSRVKFLVIGAGGLIGESVARKIDGRYPWQGTYHRRPRQGHLPLDARDPLQAEKVFDAFAPTHVVYGANLAGSVPYCERHPLEARKFHFEATKVIGKLCRAYGAKLIFVSTECVFDGRKDVYTEMDPPAPINQYGRWKAESESWIASNVPQYNIIRTMSVFGWQPRSETPNALMSAYRAVSLKREWRVPVGRWCTPTYVKDLAAAIVELALSDQSGFYHVAGPDFLTRFAWLKTCCDYLGWDAGFIAADLAPKASDRIYPEKVRLSAEKFKRQFRSPLHSLSESLALVHQDIQNNPDVR